MMLESLRINANPFAMVRIQETLASQRDKLSPPGFICAASHCRLTEVDSNLKQTLQSASCTVCMNASPC